MLTIYCYFGFSNMATEIFILRLCFNHGPENNYSVQYSFYL